MTLREWLIQLCNETDRATIFGPRGGFRAARTIDPSEIIGARVTGVWHFDTTAGADIELTLDNGERVCIDGDEFDGFDLPLDAPIVPLMSGHES